MKYPEILKDSFRDFRRELSKFGITETSEIPLDFYFSSDSRQKLDSLYRFLVIKTDYQVFRPAVGKEGWKLKGTSSTMSLQPAIFGLWIEKMFDLSDRFEVEFEGWGAAHAI